MPFAIRRYDTSRDRVAVLALDRTFSTSTVYDVERGPMSFVLVERVVNPPITRRTTSNDELNAGTPDWETAWVATPLTPNNATVYGFAATSFEPWNRRMVLQHLYVDADERRKGVARALVGHVAADARARGAIHVFVETSNLNYPAIQAYRRMGFEVCGLDLDLYAGTESAGELALFMSQPITR
jgi:ribosomal protein S18 acetylase RimI-like enzyme